MPKVDVDGPGLAETLFVLTEEILGLAVNDSARSRNKWRIFLVAPSARTRRLPSSWRKNETTTRLALENLTQSCHTSVSVVLFLFLRAVADDLLRSLSIPATDRSADFQFYSAGGVRILFFLFLSISPLFGALKRRDPPAMHRPADETIEMIRRRLYLP